MDASPKSAEISKKVQHECGCLCGHDSENAAEIERKESYVANGSQPDRYRV